jgi:hypothetical protein
MAEEKREAKKKTPRQVPVKVVKVDGKAALVEWLEKGELARGVVPVGEVHDGTCGADTLDAAAPYGVPWVKLLDAEEMKTTPTALEAELHKRGIWTTEDIEKNFSHAQAALMAALGLDIQLLLRIARQHRDRR